MRAHRYLRLGDDMSQYGTAFLSLDAGVTYLDEGATSIVAQANAPSPFTTMSNNLRLSRTFSGTSGGSGGGATPGTGLRADTLGTILCGSACVLHCVRKIAYCRESYPKCNLYALCTVTCLSFNVSRG